MKTPLPVRGHINSQNASAFIEISTLGMERASVALSYAEGGWPTDLVVAVEVTIDCRNWAQALYLDPATGNVAACPSFTAFGMRQQILVDAAVKLRLRVSTASTGGHATIDGSLYGLAEQTAPASNRIASGSTSNEVVPSGGGSFPPPDSGGGGGVSSES